ncbi:endonuclease [Aquisalimonas lutea]|uniref:endonuclease n=1 Tax=Aquisalimonas lutea TaxID=1327750 RepID=UPI0025B5247B|nr:endonuclease [Aquisalimonas lutea]MDN3519697.1 endonuclease [Aquisalimonas lutea]
MRRRGVVGLAGIVLLFVASAVLAQQTTIPDYRTARDEYFWAKLYDAGGETLYCAEAFAEKGSLTVEHIYPADWIAEAMGCENRSDCDAPLYGRAEADLHNLWPARGRINSSRGSLRFDEIPGEAARRFTDICRDYERSSEAQTVKPRNAVKGEIARSLLYMAIYYDLPLKGMGPMLIRWHHNDPPDRMERWRNYSIEQIQGTTNPFISPPATQAQQEGRRPCVTR